MKKIVAMISMLVLVISLGSAMPKDQLIEIINSRYGECTKVTFAAQVFNVPEIDSLSIENDILMVKTKNIKDKSKMYNKALDNLSFISIVTKAKDGTKMMKVMMMAGQEPMATSTALEALLLEEINGVNNNVSLMGARVFPIKFNKMKVSIEKAEINDSLLTLVVKDMKSGDMTEYYITTTGLHSVIHNNDHKKNLQNVIATFSMK